MGDKSLKNKFYYFFLTSIIMICCSARGDDAEVNENVIDCNFPANFQEIFRTNLTDLQKAAMSVGKETCKSLIGLKLEENSIRDKALESFAIQAVSDFEKMFPDSKFTGISSLVEEWGRQISNHNNDYRKFSLIEDQRGCPSEFGGRKCWELKLPSEDWGQYSYVTNPMIMDHCAEIINKSGVEGLGGADCHDAFKLWSNAVEPFQYHFTEIILKDHSKKIANLQNQWSTFIDDARYQTPLDVWATTKWYDDYFKRDQLSGPPPTQLFLLHPILVYEHLPDAEKGSKEDISLAVEWGGINWWRKGIGFSVTSVYKDRKSAPSVGHGIMIHVKNKYSFGYIERGDGDDSFFINIDLMELFGDKEEKYQKYKKYF